MEQQQVQPPPYQPEPAQPAPPEPQAHQAPQQFDAGQLFAYIQRLEGQIQALQAHPPAPIPNPNAGPKPLKPPPFGGKLNESVDSWIFQVEQYNLVVPMATDRLIPFAASYLTEHAAIWWRHTFLKQERLNPGAAWQWDDFTTRLREQFRPITSEQAGRDKLHSLRQTSSVANYISAFQSMVINIPSMSEAD